MLARKPPEERLAPSERIIIGGLGALMFGGFALDVLMEFEWLKAGALVMFVAWFGLIVVHELGHALMAGLLGWRVCRIAIGMGSPVFRFRVAGVPIVLGRYPVGGHVVPAPRQLGGARWKSALIYAAGPGAELLVILLLAAAVGFDALFGNPENFAVLSAQATALAALMGVVLNLIPVVTQDGGVSDGMGILVSPGLPNESFESRMALPYTTLAESLLLGGRREQAVRVLTSGAEALLENRPARLRLAEAFLDAGEPGKVIELLGPLVERSDIPKFMQPALLSCLSLALVRVSPERLEDADAYTEFAWQAARRAPEVCLARASVLIELGRWHQAHDVLAELGADGADDRVLDARDVLLARLEFGRGRRQSSLELIQALEARGARGPELQLLRQKLGLEATQSQKHA